MQRSQWRRRWMMRLNDQLARLLADLAPTEVEVPAHDPQAIAFSRFVKPLLRGTGLTLVATFLVWMIVTDRPFPLVNFPEGVVWADEFLGRSTLLAVGVVTLLLSLEGYRPPLLVASSPAASQAHDPDSFRRARRVGRRDGWLMRLRPLLLGLALLYLALAVYVPIANQTVRARGLQALEDQYKAVLQTIARVRADVDRNPGTVASAELLAKYPPLQALRVRPVPLSLIRDQMAEVERRGKLELERKRADGDRAILLSNLRLSGQSIAFAALFLAFWSRCPAYPRILEGG